MKQNRYVNPQKKTKPNRYVTPQKKHKWKRWEEYTIMFFVISAAVVALGAVGALIMRLLERLQIL